MGGCGGALTKYALKAWLVASTAALRRQQAQKRSAQRASLLLHPPPPVCKDGPPGRLAASLVDRNQDLHENTLRLEVSCGAATQRG